MTLGKFTKASKVVIARVGVGVFVRRGDPKPDISSREAFLRSVINAKAILRRLKQAFKLQHASSSAASQQELDIKINGHLWCR